MTEKTKILSFDEARYHESFRRSRQQNQGHISSAYASSRVRSTRDNAPLRSSSQYTDEGYARHINRGNQRSDYSSRSAAYLGVASQRQETSSAVSPRRSTRASAQHSQRNSRSEQHEKETFIQSLRKKSRSVKAEREFTKHFGKQDVQDNEQTSRAALYEMRMGRTQKRSSRMQNEDSSRKAKVGFSFESLFAWASSAITSRLVIAGLGVFFALFLLYQPLADYYGETRHLQQLEAEFSALEDQNATLQSEIDYLNTDAGLEDYARYNLGYIRADEQVVSVENITPSSDKKESSITYSIPAGSIPAPDTWYSGVLDVFFGYGK